MGKKIKNRQKGVVSLHTIKHNRWKKAIQSLDLAKLEVLFNELPKNPSNPSFERFLQKEGFPILLKKWGEEVFPEQSKRWALLLTHPTFLSAPKLWGFSILPKLLTETPSLFARFASHPSFPSSLLLNIALRKDQSLWFKQLIDLTPQSDKVLSLIGEALHFIGKHNLKAPHCEAVLFETINNLPNETLKKIDISKALQTAINSANDERVSSLLDTGIGFRFTQDFWKAVKNSYKFHQANGSDHAVVKCVLKVLPFVSEEEAVPILSSQPTLFEHICEDVCFETLKCWAGLLPQSNTLPQSIQNIHQNMILRQEIRLEEFPSSPKKM